MNTIASAISQMEILAARPAARIVEFGYVDTPPEIGVAFGATRGERMQRAVRLREADGEALLHVTTWIPEKLGRA